MQRTLARLSSLMVRSQHRRTRRECNQNYLHQRSLCPVEMPSTCVQTPFSHCRVSFSVLSLRRLPFPALPANVSFFSTIDAYEPFETPGRTPSKTAVGRGGRQRTVECIRDCDICATSKGVFEPNQQPAQSEYRVKVDKGPCFDDLQSCCPNGPASGACRPAIQQRHHSPHAIPPVVRFVGHR